MMKIKLHGKKGRGLVTLVSDEDYEDLNKHRWFAKNGGGNPDLLYVARSERREQQIVTIRMHRQIMDCPKGMEVNHKNYDPLDNRRENLEVVTKSFNSARGR